MKRWEDWGEYRATRQPAPEHGIKVKKAGTTWWGQRWIEALQHVLQGDAGRLERGRSYARAGRVHDLEPAAGKVVARVTGTRPTPYQVVIELAQLPDPAWQGAIAAMAAQAQFSAELLTGEMPRGIDEAFRAAGCSLFPEQRSELTTSCSCPDWGDPCKHVAATHYVLGDAFDRDPFLLFELRGRSRERVLEELRQARGGKPRGEQAAEVVEEVVPKVLLSESELADYDRPRAALPSLQFSFEAPGSHAAVLRQLGAPATWRAEGSPADALEPLLQRAGEAARRRALAASALDQQVAELPEARPPEAPLPEAPLPEAPPPAPRRTRKKATTARRSTKKKSSRSSRR